MKSLEELNKLLSDHLDTNDDTAYTDRQLLVELRKRAQVWLEDEKVKPDAGVERAKPATVYEMVVAAMTPDKLANLGVKLVSVNNSELFWVTTTGQLYQFNAYNMAFEAEYAWLMSNPE